MASARVRRVPERDRESLIDAPPRSVDYRLDDLILDVDGKRWDADIAGSITDARYELTIEGASYVTLSVEDPEYDLLRSGTLTKWAWTDESFLGNPGPEGFFHDESGWIVRGRDVRAQLDDLDFYLAKLALQGTKLELTLEDWIAALLRRKKGARKASRDKVTRAEFGLSLVREVKAHGGIPTHIPELHKKQPIERSSQRRKDHERRRDGHKGIVHSDHGLTVKGLKATPGQVKIMERALDVADSLDAPTAAEQALCAAIIVESQAKNRHVATDHDSLGVLQVRVSIHGRALALDVEKSVHRFLTKGFTGAGGAIKLARSGMDAASIAQAVQGSAVPSAYAEWMHEAKRWVAAYNGGGGSISGDFEKRFQFERKRGENSWDALGRLFEEVNWRRFTRKGRLWIVSEADLFRQKPVLVVERGENGVDGLDFEIDLGSRKLVAEVTVQCRAERWTAQPGEVVLVRGEGPADGRWLVANVSGSLFDEAATITLRKPIPEKPEPAAETVSVNGSKRTKSEASSKVDKVYERAVAISRKGMPYVWGGGHGKLGVPSGGGYDCSGYTSAALDAGGMMDGVPLVSGAFASSWGKPGKGSEMTVWANGEHVWIEFHGRKYKRADTSPHGDGPSGPRVRRSGRSSAGFTPRHWPGT